MLGRKLNRCRAEDGIDASSENRNFGSICRIQPELHLRALTAADPVTLHGADFFRPTGQAFEVTQELVRVMGGAQEPLFQFALLNQRIFMPPAITTVHDLFVS